MTRTNDRGIQDGQDQEKRMGDGKVVWKNKDRPVERTRVERWDMEVPKKLTLRRNRYEKGTGSQQAAYRGEDGTKLREPFNRQKDKLKPFMGMYFDTFIKFRSIYKTAPAMWYCEQIDFRKRMTALYTYFLYKDYYVINDYRTVLSDMSN